MGAHNSSKRSNLPRLDALLITGATDGFLYIGLAVELITTGLWLVSWVIVLFLTFGFVVCLLVNLLVVSTTTFLVVGLVKCMVAGTVVVVGIHNCLTLMAKDTSESAEEKLTLFMPSVTTSTEANALFNVPGFFIGVIEISLVLARIIKNKFSFVTLMEKINSCFGSSLKTYTASSGSLSSKQDVKLHGVFGPGFAAATIVRNVFPDIIS